MKYLVGILVICSLWSCKNEEKIPMDRYVLEGIIENPGFDKFFVSDISALQAVPDMVFNPTTKGYVGDSVWKNEKSFYIGNYGEKTFIYYTEPGAKIRFKTKSSDLSKNLVFEGDFADNNNYLIQSNRMIEDTVKTLGENIYRLNEDDFLARLDSIKNTVSSLLIQNKPKNSIPLVEEFLESNYKIELHNFLMQYPQAHAYETQNPNFKASETFISKAKELPVLKDSMIIYIPAYRQMLIAHYEPQLQKELETHRKEVNEKTTTPVYLLLNVLDKDSTLSQLKRDYLIGTFATQFDYTPENTMLKEVNDSLQKVVKNESVKNQLNQLYELLTDLAEGSDAPGFSGKNVENQLITGKYYKPTILYFYTTADANLDYNFEQINELVTLYKDSIQIVSINFDKDKDWRYFLKNVEVKSENLHEDKRLQSTVAKDFNIEYAVFPRTIFVTDKGKIFNSYVPALGSVEFSEELQKFLKPKVEE